MKEMMKIQPLTEEQKWIVHKFFEEFDKCWVSEHKIWIWYWRMKAEWIRIEQAEELIKKSKQRKKDSYKWKKEQEINQHLKEYKQETWWDVGRYEFVKLYERECWRSLVLWFLWNYDLEHNRQRRSHVITIDEWKNEEYFQEIIKRYNLAIE